MKRLYKTISRRRLLKAMVIGAGVASPFMVKLTKDGITAGTPAAHAKKKPNFPEKDP